MLFSKAYIKRSLLVLASGGVILCFQNCGFVMSGQITDESIGSTLPVVSSLSSEDGSDHNSLVPICAITTTKSVAHVGEIYSFKIKEPVNGNPLPVIFNVRTYGTKSNMDGSGAVVDADESSLATVYAAQLNFSNPGTIPGVYSRRFTVLDPDDGHTLCVTNTVKVTLTPSCGLSIEQDYISLNQTAIFHLNTSTLTAQQAMPSKTIWYGTKDGNGEGPFNYGIDSHYISGPFDDPSAVGIYSRYIEVADADNNVLCRTNSVNYSIYDPAAFDTGSTSVGEGSSGSEGGSSGSSSEGGGGDNGI